MPTETPTLFKQKKDYLETMLDRLVSWDQTADSAHAVLKKNQKTIEEIIKLDKSLSEEELAQFTKRHRPLMEQVIGVQEQLIKVICEEKEQLNDQMKQVNRREKVVSHYMDKEESLFVDRQV